VKREKDVGDCTVRFVDVWLGEPHLQEALGLCGVLVADVLHQPLPLQELLFVHLGDDVDVLNDLHKRGSQREP
jgi:hypothetical protein